LPDQIARPISPSRHGSDLCFGQTKRENESASSRESAWSLDLGRTAIDRRDHTGDFLFFRKSGNEEAERTTDPTVVNHKLLRRVSQAHDLCHHRIHDQICAIRRIQRRPFILVQIDCAGKRVGNLIRVTLDPLKCPLLSMLIVDPPQCVIAREM
jgi:hypothetical protein